MRAELRERANPAQAPAMRAYMKSALPFHGVKAPVVAEVCKRAIAAHPLDGRSAWESAVRELWQAEFREERYAALHVATHRAYREHRDAKALPLFEGLIVEGAWWDLVDWVAGKILIDVWRADRAAMTRRAKAWARSPDLWLKRAAVICQIKRKSETDVDLLHECIGRCADSQEFFLRKAIGWALREHGKTDPAGVRRWVRENEERLSPLSRREALKNL